MVTPAASWGRSTPTDRQAESDSTPVETPCATGVARSKEVIAAHPGCESRRRKIMSLKGLAPMFMALFVIANTGAAFASPPASGKTDTAETGNLGEALTVLHAVGQWSIDVSKMADERAKSDLVKNYARTIATANADTD